MDNITYRVRMWKTETYKGARVTTYKVRWTTGSKQWKRPFRTKAQAASLKPRSAQQPAEARHSTSPPDSPFHGAEWATTFRGTTSACLTWT